MEDRLCIEKVLQGECHYFASLVERYKQMAFSLALSIVKDSFIAEDVVQESFISAYSHLHKFAFKSSFSTWLYTIVVRQSYKQCKKKKFLQKDIAFIRDEEIYALSDYQQGLEQLMIEERNLCLQQALNSLVEIEQVSIKLFYMEEKSIKEIADILNLSIPNIKVILHRARKKLYEQLKHILSKK